jgi:anti-anti-sigma factor
MVFSATSEIINNTAIITLSGELDASSAPDFKSEVEKATERGVVRLVLKMADLDYMASAGLRVFIFAKQKLGSDKEIYVVSPQEMVLDTLQKTGFHNRLVIVNSYDPATSP